MSKIELELKEDFHIVEDGSLYQVPMYEVVEGEGLKKQVATLPILFVRGSKLGEDQVEPKTGTLHEHLLSVMIHDLEKKNGLVPAPQTDQAILKLKEALNWMRDRQVDRITRDVQGTYKQ